jgi:hypothetical protein
LARLLSSLVAVSIPCVVGKIWRADTGPQK